MYCKRPKELTKEVDITTFMKEFFDSISVSWDTVEAICNDGTPAMLENESCYFGNTRLD
jgi:hypothetical protein